MGDTSKPEQWPRDRSARNQELSFTDVVHFFRRNWRLILGLAVLTGLGTTLVLLLVPNKYEASATLYIVPPSFSSDLKPQTLTIQSYQKILESDAVIAEAKRRLVAQNQFPSDRPLRLGVELESRIFVARRAEEATTPMLQAVARGRTGEQAAALANTWAEVFLARTRELAVGSMSAAFQFIVQQYSRVRDSLAKIENSRIGEANAFQNRFNETAMRWGDRITAFKGETTSLITAFQAETDRLTEDFSSRHDIDSRKGQLAALRKVCGELQEEQARVVSQLDLKHLQLDAARSQLARTTPLVTLQKAITDDALWRSVADAKGGSPDWKALQGRSLTSQEVNPVYTALSSKVADIEMDVTAMVPRAAGLTKDLDRINNEMKSLEAGLRDDQATLEKLQRGRDAGLAELQEQRENKLARVQRGRQTELDSVKSEMDTRLAELDRDIGPQRELFDRLAKNYNQALLVKGQQDLEDVQLGAPAVQPQTAQPRGLVTKSLLAFMLGGLVGIGASLIREAIRGAVP